MITNAAHTTPGINTTFTVTTVADTDRDGIPDDFENTNRLNPNDPADATGDLDGDSMSNRAEYVAGTNPDDPASYLKVEQSTTPGVASVWFPAISNRTYTVQYSDTLSPTAWTRLGDVLARSTNRLETLTDLNWSTNRFYRLVLPAQP